MTHQGGRNNGQIFIKYTPFIQPQARSPAPPPPVAGCHQLLHPVWLLIISHVGDDQPSKLAVRACGDECARIENMVTSSLQLPSRRLRRISSTCARGPGLEFVPCSTTIGPLQAMLRRCRRQGRSEQMQRKRALNGP